MRFLDVKFCLKTKMLLNCNLIKNIKPNGFSGHPRKILGWPRAALEVARVTSRGSSQVTPSPYGGSHPLFFFFFFFNKKKFIYLFNFEGILCKF
jgi:hypothetical protein